MKRKICFKCNIEKDLSKYYKHSKMSDGHLGKCKDCTKKDSKSREIELRKNPEWIEKEKKRARERYFKLGYKEKHKSSSQKKKEAINRYREKYPEKILAKNISNKLKALVKGNQLHHWSYNEAHAKDVIELSVLEHAKAHRYMIYDQERMMYRRADNNELLDTKDAHIEFIESLKNKP